MTCEITFTRGVVKVVNYSFNGVKAFRGAVVVLQVDGVEGLAVFEIHLLHVGDVGDPFKAFQLACDILCLSRVNVHHAYVRHTFVVKLTFQHVKSL